jgi:thymidylate kinase
MNMKNQDDIQIVSTIISNAGFDVSAVQTATYSQPLQMMGYNNTDGSLRWAWPTGSNQPNCLRFYNIASVKAKIFSLVFKIAFATRLTGLLAKTKFTLFAQPGTEGALKNIWGNNFAIFTGTVGPNRKGVIWYKNKTEQCFIKVALSENAAAIIGKEAAALTILQQYNFKQLQLPTVKEAADTFVTLSDINTGNTKRGQHFTVQHAKALEELYEVTTCHKILKNLDWWQQTTQKLETLAATNDARIPKGLLRKLQLLHNAVDEEQVLAVATAHGDFTPWNMYVTTQQLKVYDWELIITEAPLWWDAFHFIFQSGILMHRQNAKTILAVMDELQEQQIFTTTTAATLQNNLQLYLLYNTVYYLDVYAHQPNWHMQVNWLLQTWNEAISVALVQNNLTSQRALFCIDLFDYLSGKNYATLKWLTHLPEELPETSDIDLCIAENEKVGLHNFLQNHPFAATVSVSHKSFMNNYGVVLNDASLLSVDAIWKIKRTHLEILTAQEVLSTRKVLSTGVQVPSVANNFNYTWLFYLLNNAPVPEKYQEQFLLKPEAERQQLNRHFTAQWLCTGVTHFGFAMAANKEIRAAVLQQIKEQPANKNWQFIKNKIGYYMDTATNLFSSKGMIITFSGVDGAGKSTVIENTRQQIEKVLRKKVVVLRHRPSVLPILSAWKHGKEAAEKKAATTLPRQGKNNSSFSSFIRFAYYYSDYFFGQFYIQVKHVWRGHVVLYDRYYFDFINDSKRSNIQLPAKFTSWFYRFLLKPQLNFFLYAQPEEILKRKQELDAATIKELTEKYLALFTSLSKQYHSSSYIPIHNQHLETTINTIVQHIKTRA